MPSKFGGVEVETKSKFGGIPVEDEAPKSAPAPAPQEPGNHGLREFVTSPHGLIRTGLSEAYQGAKSLFKPGMDAKAKGLHQIVSGGFRVLTPAAIPLAVAAPVAAATAAGVGFVGSEAAKYGARRLGAGPGVQELAGDAGGFVGGGMGGRMGGTLRKAAAPLAENALGIRGAAREYGATPGKAILEETTGVRPGTVERSAQAKVSDLTSELENRALSAKTPISLGPAREIARGAIDKAQAGNSIARELKPISEHLTIPHAGFKGKLRQPPAPMVEEASAVLGPDGKPVTKMVPGKLPPAEIAEQQWPIDFLGMKRRLGQDFTSFTPGRSTPESVQVANEVYGRMARDFNAAVPGGSALNQRIQSLLPVIKRAHAEELNPSAGERVLNRVARPTGGLLPLIFGYHEGGIPGALATLFGQEGLTSPTARMAAARTLYKLGKPLRLAPSALIGEQSQ